MAEVELNELEISAIGEVGNICFGNAMTTLGVLVHSVVDLSTPTVVVKNKGDLVREHDDKAITARVDYVKGIQGASILFLKEEDVKMITDLMMGSDGYGMFYQQEFNEMHLSAASEAMNQMMGASATAMGIMLDKLVDISTPITEVVSAANVITGEFPNDEKFAQVEFEVKIGDLFITNMIQLFPLKLAKAIADLFIIQKGQKES